MIVYHGSTEVVEKPDINHSYRFLDFGAGFYVTTVREQAVSWAKRKADLSGKDNTIINIYQMDENLEGFRVKTFPEDLLEWIDFVCQCRDGKEKYKFYDLIWGKVADDKVFRVVDLYKNGIWDKERALKEIRVYPAYDQIAFIKQEAIDHVLKFQTYEEV